MSTNETLVGSLSDARPLVAAPARRTGVWIFIGGIGIAGILLFQTLEARRATLNQPTTSRSIAKADGVSAEPQELEIPPSASDLDTGFEQGGYWQQRPRVKRSSPVSIADRAAVTPQTRVTAKPVAPFEVMPGLGVPPPRQPLPSATDTTSEARYTGATTAAGESANDPPNGRERVQATRFGNPGTTVPKGTVIQAILETALDSTRPGFARAIVSRDVYAFDGNRVLIPRGSRLIGEYKADVAIGQKRALIQWQRLMRPDGIIVNLDSPAADPLGRAGVGGKVNTHFFERFAGSILQSVLDVGVQLGARRLSRDTYILALPGSAQGVIGTQGDKIPPTVIVRQGSSVSVFVARDLDFTVVDQ